jgi:hypothetical protein
MDILHDTANRLLLELHEQEHRSALVDKEVAKATWALLTCSISEYLSTIVGIDEHRIPKTGHPWSVRLTQPWLSRQQKLEYLEKTQRMIGLRVQKLQTQIEQLRRLMLVGYELYAPRRDASVGSCSQGQTEPGEQGGLAHRQGGPCYKLCRQDGD